VRRHVVNGDGHRIKQELKVESKPRYLIVVFICDQVFGEVTCSVEGFATDEKGCEMASEVIS
jgi:hypothetical protein